MFNPYLNRSVVQMTHRKKDFILTELKSLPCTFPTDLIYIIYDYSYEEKFFIHRPVIQHSLFCDKCTFAADQKRIVSCSRIVACIGISCFTTLRSVFCCWTFPFFWCGSTIKNLCGTCGDLHFELRECVSSCVATCVHCLLICACSAFSEGDTFLTNGCSCCSFFSGKENCQTCPYAITSGTRMFQMEKVLVREEMN
jgi:hypothetical protein